MLSKAIYDPLPTNPHNILPDYGNSSKISKNMQNYNILKVVKAWADVPGQFWVTRQFSLGGAYALPGLIGLNIKKLAALLIGSTTLIHQLMFTALILSISHTSFLI